ncbi:MAG: hypothetical protein ACRDJH_20885 [Thermomicrobiales bacterium]
MTAIALPGLATDLGVDGGEAGGDANVVGAAGVAGCSAGDTVIVGDAVVAGVVTWVPVGSGEATSTWVGVVVAGVA